jgi:hypothetical protein
MWWIARPTHLGYRLRSAVRNEVPYPVRIFGFHEERLYRL